MKTNKLPSEYRSVKQMIGDLSTKIDKGTPLHSLVEASANIGYLKAKREGRSHSGCMDVAFDNMLKEVSLISSKI